MVESWLGLAMEEPAGWVGYFEGNLVSFLQTQEQVNQFLENTEPVGQVFPVYTNPLKREWVGLTDAEIKDILDCGRGGLIDIKKAEAKLKEKNYAGS